MHLNLELLCCRTLEDTQDRLKLGKHVYRTTQAE